MARRGKHRIVVTTGTNDRIIAVCKNCEEIIFDDNNVEGSLNRINKAARFHKKGGIFLTEADIIKDLENERPREFWPKGYREKLFTDFDPDANLSAFVDPKTQVHYLNLGRRAE